MRVSRDLSDMTHAAVLAVMWPHVGRWLRDMYRAGTLNVTIGAVEMVPRNQVEGWPVREVVMTSTDGRVNRSALVSLEADGRDLVRLMPPGRATPGRS